MFFNWIPWKFIVRRLAKSHGFLDPINLFSRLSNFGKPSEVSMPIELLRGGVVFHARGLLNTRAIQHNLDWVWPYWVRRQYDPNDESFLPRAFSVTHVNLTHRNWTAVGLPGLRAFPIVDPRGLLTPFYDGWSIDTWLLRERGQDLIPARHDDVVQEFCPEPDNISVSTRLSDDAASLQTHARVEMIGEEPTCVLHSEGVDESQGPAWLCVALRPFNPEGVSLLSTIGMGGDRRTWQIDDKVDVLLSDPADRFAGSTYEDGDVHDGIFERPETDEWSCQVGMASAAALYRLEPGEPREITTRVNLMQDKEARPHMPRGKVTSWPETLKNVCTADLPDERMQQIFDAAVRALVLMSPGDTYPGPYTYRRFWFRDAALILNAVVSTGLHDIGHDIVHRWRPRQSPTGYFHSQEGEWDSNGEVLWALWRQWRLSGKPLDTRWRNAVVRAGRWIKRKRTRKDTDKLHAGLLPAGFSAEHLGNNDYYYWDDFWSVGGLQSAAAMCGAWDDQENREAFRREADDLLACIEKSLERSWHIREHEGMSAAPYRRMDSGAVGSLAVGYPLQLWTPQDSRLLGTVDYLLEHCTVKDMFFQDMIHSGLNAYLTLHMAQVLMRAEDTRFYPLVKAVADSASPTGQWPEAVHPRTGGGCMGDGQHIWAVAEWIMMIRNMFVREEYDSLVLAGGIPKEWRRAGQTMHFGPTPTPWGPVTVSVDCLEEGGGVTVSWKAAWRSTAPDVRVALPGMGPQSVEGGAAYSVTVEPLSGEGNG